MLLLTHLVDNFQ